MVTSPDFVNDTELVADPLAEVDAELEHEFHKYHIVWTMQAVFVFLKMAVCLVSVAAFLFLAITILRFKRLQSRFNAYILHMCILITLLYFLVPAFITILDMVLHSFVIFYMMALQNMFLMTYIVFGLLLAVDWTLSNYNYAWVDLYHRYYKYCLAGIYLFFLVYTSVMIFTNNYGMMLMSIFLVFYVICGIIMVALNLLKRFTRSKPEHQKTAYVMTVANIVIFSFAPTFGLYYFITTVLPHNFIIDLIIVFVEGFTVVFTLGHPILIVYYLGRSNKYFKMAYSKSFKRSVRSYGDDDLDEVSEDENPDINKVVVNYCNEHGVEENKQVLII